MAGGESGRNAPPRAGEAAPFVTRWAGQLPCPIIFSSGTQYAERRVTVRLIMFQLLMIQANHLNAFLNIFSKGVAA